MRHLGLAIVLALVAIGGLRLWRSERPEPAKITPVEELPFPQEAIGLVLPDDDSGGRDPVPVHGFEPEVATRDGQARSSATRGSRTIEDFDTWALLVSIFQEGEIDLTTEIRVLAFDAAGEQHVADEWSGGSAGFRLLTPGPYVVTANGLGWKETSVDVWISGAAVPQRVALTLERVPVIHVRAVTPQGAPLMNEIGAQWDLCVAVGPAASLESLADPQDGFDESVEVFGRGRWGGWQTDLEDEVIARLELHGTRPRFLHLLGRGYPLATQALPPGVDDVTFVVDPIELASKLTSLRCEIVDEEMGLPVEGGVVWLFVGGKTTARGTVGPGGIYECSSLVPGLCSLGISVPGYALCEPLLDLGDRPPGQVTRIELERARSMEGRVHNAHAARHSTRLSFQSVEGFLERRRTSQPVRVDSDGKFSLALATSRVVVWGEAKSAFGHDARLAGPCCKLLPRVVDPAEVAGEVVVEFSPVAPLIVRAEKPCTLEVLGPAGLLVKHLRVGANPRSIELVPGEYTLRTVELGRERMIRYLALPPEGATVVLD